MDKKTIKEIVKLYSEGLSLRQITEAVNSRYGREIIRKNLKNNGLILRGRGMEYKHPKEMDIEDSDLFAELLGYLYGDGSLHEYRDKSHGCYDCHLFFSLDEKDLARRVSYITKKLFGFTPNRQHNKKRIYDLKLKRSFAKYLAGIGYPSGKKSVLNPYLPFNFLKTNSEKQHFVCGFFNAEAGINKTITIQQSVRIKLPVEDIKILKNHGQLIKLHNNDCYFINWGFAKEIISPALIKESNILSGVKEILDNFKIESKLYPVRVYIGKNDKIGVHFELRILNESLKKIKDFNMLSCTKKLDILNNILQG